MFIGWISQMLPLMDKPEGEAVDGILHSIAATYPQVKTMIYTFYTNFRLTMPALIFLADHVSTHVLIFIHRSM